MAATRLDQPTLKRWWEQHGERPLSEDDDTKPAWSRNLPETEQLVRDVICSTERAHCMEQTFEAEGKRRYWSRLYRGENGRLFVEHGEGSIEIERRMVRGFTSVVGVYASPVLFVLFVKFFVAGDLSLISMALGLLATVGTFFGSVRGIDSAEVEKDELSSAERDFELIDQNDENAFHDPDSDQPRCHPDILKTLLKYRLYDAAEFLIAQDPSYEHVFRAGDHRRYYRRTSLPEEFRYLHTFPNSPKRTNCVRITGENDLKETIQNKHGDEAYRSVFGDDVEYA